MRSILYMALFDIGRTSWKYRLKVECMNRCNDSN